MYQLLFRALIFIHPPSLDTLDAHTYKEKNCKNKIKKVIEREKKK